MADNQQNDSTTDSGAAVGSDVNAGMYTISIKTYRVTDIPGLENDPVHHEIVFRNPDGYEIAFNGNPHDRESGYRQGISLHGRDTLRVMAEHGTMEDRDFSNQFPAVGEEIIHATQDPDEALVKMGKAMEAGRLINAQNMDYVIMDVFEPGQNSNSVVNTIVKAMGLEIPDEVREHWAPGIDRNLLPEDHVSRFDQNLPEGDYIMEAMDDLNIANVSKQVENDPNPYEGYSVRKAGHPANKGNSVTLDKDRTGRAFDPEKMVEPRPLPHEQTDNAEIATEQATPMPASAPVMSSPDMG